MRSLEISLINVTVIKVGYTLKIIVVGFRLTQPNSEVELDLDIEGYRNGSQGMSKIRIQFSALEPPKAVSAALADARKEADDIGRGKVATAVGLVDDAQGYVEGAQNVAGNLDAFGTVLDKIDVFVKIVDKTASVRCQACNKSL
jgi:hypothetical protein